ncbi:MAG TPA: HAD family phosphatase [Candidatus Latescibacteria bacterium]|nr:HAD family phosphatase [Candidatus Latescibacterota bacterium]
MTPSEEARISFAEKTRLAVIDLDGTLLKGMNAERIFYLHLLVQGRVGAMRMATFLLTLLGDLLRLGFRRTIATNARILRGETPEAVRQWAREFGRVFLKKAVPDDLRDKILSLKQEGCRIVLLSGSLQLLVDQLKERLEAEILIGTDLEVDDGKLTGRKTGIFPYGRMKVDALFQKIDPDTIDWPRSWALADRKSDLPVLELVGHPVAVHSDRKLRKLARQRGWEIIG